MTYLILKFFGPLQVMLNDRPIVTFPYEKVRALLSYLAIESDYPHQREQLASLFWADQAESKARSNLRKALFTLRQMLAVPSSHPPLFLTTRNTIQFNSTVNYRLDIDQFSQLLSQHRFDQPISHLSPQSVSDLAQAVALYRGDFLAQLQLPESDHFETWIRFHREHYREQAISACTQLIAYHEHQRQTQEVHHYAQRLLQLEPWNEPAHQALLRLLAQQGRRQAALHQYERYCQILEQQLAAEPNPILTDLYDAIQSGQFPDLTHLSSLKPRDNRLTIQLAPR